MEILGSKDVLAIHEFVIEPEELQGLAGDKSLDAVVSRVLNRIQYGLINDMYDLAATYAVVLAVGHVFNDANKWTAYRTMMLCLELNGVDVQIRTEEVGQLIVKSAQGQVDVTELAGYLRACR